MYSHNQNSQEQQELQVSQDKPICSKQGKHDVCCFEEPDSLSMGTKLRHAIFYTKASESKFQKIYYKSELKRGVFFVKCQNKDG